MRLSDNDFEILKLLVKFHQISISEISKIKGVTQQTIKNSLHKIDEFLEKNFNFTLDIDYPIVKLPLSKIELLKTVSFDFEKSVDISKHDRVIYILLHLIFERKINVLKIADELSVTKLTVMKDVADAKKEIEKFDLKITNVPWKGSFLFGDEEKILRFSVHFLMLFFINKVESPYLNNIYKIVVNPVNIKYLSKFLSKTLYLKIQKTVKSITAKSEIKVSQLVYYSFISAVTYISIYKVFNVKAVDVFWNEYLNNKAKEMFFILKNEELFKELSCSDDDLKVFVELFIGSYNFENLESVNPEISELINRIQNILNLTFNVNERLGLTNFLSRAHVESDFTILNPISYFVKDDIIFEEIEDELISEIKKIFPNIYTETLFQVLFYIQNIYLDRLERDGNRKKVLIIDGSFLHLQGTLLQKEILKKYFVGNVHLISFLDDRDYDNISRHYDLVIYLDTYCDDEHMYSIPVHIFSLSSAITIGLDNIGLKKRYR